MELQHMADGSVMNPMTGMPVARMECMGSDASLPMHLSNTVAIESSVNSIGSPTSRMEGKRQQVVSAHNSPP
eukprot:CAMPEP_0172203188 /NCGR_PEP_ID=MMETSP1050-20130122/31125_1 /TAXON_ID=233186 /ORGANISM="Cryptomonas curvata, Strain CCAP979/52" /LENGTH=71 /DNA_ID=CAMNT_0012881335 /DNA_START=114 /DNA_END=332 /DNA_ORIENTATION=-